MKIAISAESTIDLPKNLLEKFDIHVLPLYVRLGQEEFLDGTINQQKIFDYVKKTKQLPKTSAQNIQNYQDFFEGLLTDYDAVIHFAISSKISSSYQNAFKAAENMENVFVMDTLSLSTGIALLAISARNLANTTTLSAKEIFEETLKRREHNQTSFILLELNYLFKGGRCSSLQYFGSNLLKIKPQIVMENGAMHSGKKFMGNSDTAYIKYVNGTLEEYNTPDLENVFITYTTCKDEIVEEIKKILVKRGFKNVYVTRAGATITSYCGEGCLGILYFNDGK